jgi:hypothetical protein
MCVPAVVRPDEMGAGVNDIDTMLIDIFRCLSLFIVSVYMGLFLNLLPCSFVSLRLQGTKYNVEGDDV